MDMGRPDWNRYFNPADAADDADANAYYAAERSLLLHQTTMASQLKVVMKKNATLS